MFCAPIATFEPLAAAISVGSSTGEGNKAISSRVCPATSGKKASTKALASAGVLYIFQLAAISALRGIFLGLLESIVMDDLRTQGDDEHNTGQLLLFQAMASAASAVLFQLHLTTPATKTCRRGPRLEGQRQQLEKGHGTVTADGGEDHR